MKNHFSISELYRYHDKEQRYGSYIYILNCKVKLKLAALLGYQFGNCAVTPWNVHQHNLQVEKTICAHSLCFVGVVSPKLRNRFCEFLHITSYEMSSIGTGVSIFCGALGTFHPEPCLIANLFVACACSTICRPRNSRQTVVCFRSTMPAKRSSRAAHWLACAARTALCWLWRRLCEALCTKRTLAVAFILWTNTSDW